MAKISKKRATKTIPPIARKVPVKKSLWEDWPKWIDDDTFQTPNFRFHGKVDEYKTRSSAEQITILKSKATLEPYRKIAESAQIQNILEIGFYQGGMPLFLADMLSPRRIVAVDKNPAPDSVLLHLKEKGLSNIVEYIGGVDQADTERIRQIVADKFGGEPLDLIIDDCSHFYDLTKGCFEQLFGFLRPGGKYIIEDWGWTHWPEPFYQSERNPFRSTTSMTNLIMEIIMTQPSRRGIVKNVEVANGACVIVTRGGPLKHGETFDLQKSINIAPGYKADLITTSDKKSV